MPRTFPDEHHHDAEPAMPEKPNRKQKNGPSSGRATKAAAPRSKPGRSPQAPAVYIAVSPACVVISAEKPKGAKAAAACAGFEAAKHAVIGALVGAIEDAERQVAACKRATTIDELRAL